MSPMSLSSLKTSWVLIAGFEPWESCTVVQTAPWELRLRQEETMVASDRSQKYGHWCLFVVEKMFVFLCHQKIWVLVMFVRSC